MDEQPASNGTAKQGDTTNQNPVVPIPGEQPIAPILETTEPTSEKNKAETSEQPKPNSPSLWQRFRAWRKARPRREPARFTDHLIAWSTIVMTLATIAIAYLAYETGSQTDKIISADERIAKAMEDSVTKAGNSLDATIDQFHLDQRAWVGVLGTTPPDIKREESQQTLKIGVILTNSGKTPAKILQTDVSINHYPVSAKFVPVYKGVKEALHSVAVLQPNMPYTVMSLPTTFNKITLQGIADNTERAYFYGRIRYKDVFDREHTTTFCMFFSSALNQPLGGCDTYSNAD